MHHTRSIRFLLLLAATCGVPALAGAQTVHGRVLEAGTNDPVGGAIVSVLTEAGARAAATLSDTSGTYRVSVAGPGAYTLRVERVGYVASTSERVHLQAGQTLEVRLTA
ncbi:carboxypeptidase-like regulatory domain-containing protein, partial [Longimicrobium sp.]|uniref:carboxypeptidase-like regulatory domain-containing protein n=1 Tax=Longimicrobium sp. TaxID=2029185 RepID=UPI002E379C65